MATEDQEKNSLNSENGREQGNDQNEKKEPFKSNEEGEGNNDNSGKTVKKRRRRVSEVGGGIPIQRTPNFRAPTRPNAPYGEQRNYHNPGEGNGQRPYSQPNREYRPSPNRMGNASNNRYDNPPRRQVYQKQGQGGGYNNYNNNYNRARGNNNFRNDNRLSFPPRPSKYREEHFDPNEPIRLNKYLANAGVCSRREADEYIQAGVVKVNGETVTELGTKVIRSDKVMFHDQAVQLEQKVYVLLNKPKNCVTTSDDPQERLTVMDLVKAAGKERIFPVGRLDRNTTGVLLLTNDGDLASKLTHPKYLKKKIYHVWLDKDIKIDDMKQIAEGIQLEDGEVHADAISYVTDTDKNQVGIEIHSGRNRIVRRIFETLGYHVTKLDRVYFAGLTKKNLKRGQWRFLTEKEVSMLRMGAFS